MHPMSIVERSDPMNTTETTDLIPKEIKTQLQQTLDDLVKGIRRRDKMKEACERMDRMREENRKLFGEQDIAVELIRQTRDQA
jgi:succinate dehydrogenase/fumarate reductase flavoprotein subunit